MWLQPIIVDDPTFPPSHRDTPFPTELGLRETCGSFTLCQIFVRSFTFHIPVPSMDLATDASDFGWSRVIGLIPIHDSWTILQLARDPSDPQLGFLPSGLSCSQDYQDSYDSMVALFCLKRMVSLHSAEISATIRHLLYCVKNEILYLFLSTSQDV